MVRFIHAADLHLDTPLRGLTRYEGAPIESCRTAVRDACVQMVTEALDEEVDFLILSGDIYDGDWPDFNTGLFFAQQMSRLKKGGIPVFMIRGNHDAASRITKTLTLPDNVIEFPTHEAGTHFIEELKVAVHGQSYGEREEQRNLAVDYPLARRGYLNIGLLHTSLTGRAGHASYAPCTLDDLFSREYDYWALGHVHNREIVHQDPWVVFPGNLQGRHIRESGEKGYILVDADDKGVQAVTFRPLHYVQWHTLTLQDGSEEALSALRSTFEALPTGIVHLCRVAVEKKEQDLHALRHAIIALANEIGDETIGIEKVIQRSSEKRTCEIELSDDLVSRKELKEKLEFLKISTQDILHQTDYESLFDFLDED